MGNSASPGLGGSANYGLRDVGLAEPSREVKRPSQSSNLIWSHRKLIGSRQLLIGSHSSNFQSRPNLTNVPPLPGCVDDVSSVESVVDLLVVGAGSGPSVYKRPDICQLLLTSRCYTLYRLNGYWSYQCAAFTWLRRWCVVSWTWRGFAGCCRPGAFRSRTICTNDQISVNNVDAPSVIYVTQHLVIVIGYSESEFHKSCTVNSQVKFHILQAPSGQNRNKVSNQKLTNILYFIVTQTKIIYTVSQKTPLQFLSITEVT